MRFQSMFAVTLIFATAYGISAHAQSLLLCLQRCAAIPACDPAGGGSEANCSSARSVCESQCSGGSARRLGPPLRSLEFGAIAFDLDTGKAGKSWGDGNGQVAFKVAQRYCLESGGRTCDYSVVVSGGCAVIAEGDGGHGRVGHRKSGGREAYRYARNAALTQCRAGGGQNCRVVGSTCSWGAPD